MKPHSASWRQCVHVWLPVLVIALACSCDSGIDRAHPREEKPYATTVTENQTMIDHAKARSEMVDIQLAARDIVDPSVLDAMRRVPRHAFVPAHVQSRAYGDAPIPIGYGQTISQPYIVALMTQLAQPQAHKKALDVGTGSGYQAAVLAELVRSVHSIEIVEPLAAEATERLEKLGYRTVQVRHGDGYHGWPSEAPFDIIIVAAAPDHVPPQLVEQLAPGGRLIIPVGTQYQKLLVVEKDEAGAVSERNVAPVAFVPMTGAAEQ